MIEYIIRELSEIKLIEILGVFILFMLGYSFSGVLLGRRDNLLRIAFAFPLGFGLVSVLLFILHLIGFSLNITSILIPSLILLLILIACRFKSFYTEIKNIKNAVNGFRVSYSITHLVFVLLILCVLSIIFLKSIFLPPISWDVVTSFDLNAKAISQEGTLLHSLITEGNNIGVGVAYPPFISLSYSYLYFFEFDFPKILPPLILFSFSLFFYTLLKRYTNKTWAIIITFLFLITPDILGHGAIGQTNLTFAFFSFSSFGMVYLWLNNREQFGYLILSFILAAFASFTRGEGIIINTILFAFIFLNDKKAFFKKLALFLGSLIPFIAWQVYSSVHSQFFAKYTQASFKFEYLFKWNSEKVGLILDQTLNHFANTSSYGISFYLLLVFSVAIALYLVFNLNAPNLTKIGLPEKNLLLIIAIWGAYILLLNSLHFEGKGDQAKNITPVVLYSYKRFLYTFIPFIWFLVGHNNISFYLSHRIKLFTTRQPVEE